MLIKDIKEIRKYVSLLFLGLLLTNVTWACEVCQANQPKALRNITHGTGPQDNLDWIIIWSAVIIVAITLILSIKFLVKPKETETEHIKNIVVDN